MAFGSSWPAEGIKVALDQFIVKTEPNSDAKVDDRKASPSSKRLNKEPLRAGATQRTTFHSSRSDDVTRALLRHMNEKISQQMKSEYQDCLNCSNAEVKIERFTCVDHDENEFAAVARCKTRLCKLDEPSYVLNIDPGGRIGGVGLYPDLIFKKSEPGPYVYKPEHEHIFDSLNSTVNASLKALNAAMEERRPNEPLTEDGDPW
jgi:hypothetical protein